MNWGWKPALVYCTFVGLMLMLVFKSRSEKIDLVRTDYYEAEIAHQQQMDASINAQKLSAPVAVQYTGGDVILVFPTECRAVDLEGSVHFYRPSDVNLDQTFSVKLDSEGKMNVNSTAMKSGLYVIKMNWMANGIKYFQEESIYIQ